jgi:perosamine synthetase
MNEARRTTAGEAAVALRRVPFFQPDITEEEITAVVETLRSGWLTAGPVTQRFESEFAAAVDAPHAIAVNSCTAALHLALDALALQPGDEVITSTLTFAASAATIIHAGGRPVLVDVTPDTLNLDPQDVARKITPRTRAIVPVHFGGHPAPMTDLLVLADAHRLAVVEDAAHALPAAYRKKRIGTIGDMTY